MQRRYASRVPKVFGEIVSRTSPEQALLYGLNRAPGNDVRSLLPPAGVVQRKCGSACGCSECLENQADRFDPDAVLALQRLIGNGATIRLLDSRGVQAVIGSSGEELEPAAQKSMERRFGTSFSDVRIHYDGAAADSADALDAEAYTTGTHIVFAEGYYDPYSADGQRTLAHELAHVVQQRSGPVAGVPVGNGLSISDPGDSFEKAAEQTAGEVMDSVEPAQTGARRGSATEHTGDAKTSSPSFQGCGIATLQRRVVCPPGVDPEEGTGCYETADDQTGVPAGDSTAPSQEEPNFTPAPGGYSSDPMQGGSSQAPAPDDGGFTPAPGARSYDPDQGGSSKATPEQPNFTPGPGGYSSDPMQGGSSQAPAPNDGGFTPAPGARSYDPFEGGSSQTPPCDVARASAAYQQASRKEQEAALDAAAAKDARDQAKTLQGSRCVVGGALDPVACANAQWEVKRTTSLFEAAALKACHASQDTQQALKNGGCNQTLDLRCN